MKTFLSHKETPIKTISLARMKGASGGFPPIFLSAKLFSTHNYYNTPHHDTSYHNFEYCVKFAARMFLVKWDPFFQLYKYRSEKTSPMLL